MLLIIVILPERHTGFMLTFINSLILGLLSAALIPVLIHLFNRQKPRKIQFSALQFLLKLEKRRLKRIRIYQYLLILVRTLLILFLVFAFARPTLTGQAILPDQTARTTAVLLLDSGINMRAFDSQGNH